MILEHGVIRSNDCEQKCKALQIGKKPNYSITREPDEILKIENDKFQGEIVQLCTFLGVVFSIDI